MAKKITKKSLKKNVVHKNVSGKIITVKNADGDSDTKATILIQNRINYTPKVSVIIPVYNVEKYLPECLDSVISQTLKEIEIICVDDGSTDNSVNILKEYAKKDKRITVLRQTNLHAGVARNAGIAVAKGEYFSFLDSDDFFELDMLESLVKIAEKDKSDVVICGNYVFDQMENKDVRTTQYREQFINKSPFNPKDIAADLFMMCNPNAWTKLFRSANIRKYNIRFEKFISCNDITFVCTNLALAEKISIINTPYVHYRVNTKINISSNRGDNAICLVLAVDKLIQNLKSYDVYDKFKDTLKQRLKSSFIWELKQCTEKQAVKLREEAKALFDQQLYDFVCSEKPKVSVIIPVYNVEKYLPQCLDSAINQSMKEIEIICVNDGSPDNSLAILQDYAKKDSRIKIINQKNQGLSASRNNALQIVRGEYILFLDSDDWIDKDTCKDLYEYAKKFDLDMINFEGINYDSETGELNQLPAQKNPYVSESGVCFTKEQVDTFIDKIGISACRVFYKTDFIQKNNLQFPVGLCFEDNYFLLKALNLMQRYGVLHKILYYRRTHPGQITANWDKFFGDYINIIKKVDEMYHEIGIDKGVNYRKIINKYCCGAISRLNSFDVMNRNRYIKDLYKLLSKLSEKVEFDKPVLDFLKKVQKNEIYADQVLDWFAKRSGIYINLADPKTYNEKIQWLKIFDSTPIKTKLADKLLVRDWAAERIGEQYLIPLLGVYDRFEDIDFSKLPDKFVIKCNHGCAYNIIVKDKSKLDLAEVKEKLDTWMAENFAFKAGFELHYRDIKPKIIIEKYIENQLSGGDLYDYKFWCFNGRVEYIQFLSERNLDGLKMAFYDRNWRKQDFVYSYPLDAKNIPAPDNLDKMIELAETLSKNFGHVRVDFYRLDDGTVYLGEMTFTSASGLCKWNDEKINRYFGRLIKLPKLAYNIDTEEYYKLPKKSLLKSYLLLPYYFTKLQICKKRYRKAAVKNIEKQLHTARIDIKNNGGSDNDINIVTENAKVIKPAWFKNEKGQGAVLESNAKEIRIQITVVKNGALSFAFKAPDRRCDGKRFPVYAKYASIKIDGRELLSEPISVWHDAPFKYEMPVKDGQVLQVIINQIPHIYDKKRLKGVILKLNPNSDSIKQNIDYIMPTKFSNRSKDITFKNLSELSDIESSLFISVGPACKPAHWLKVYGLRKAALPFDWMKSYSLQVVERALDSSISDWFIKNYERDTNNSVHRAVVDLETGMLSLHHFPISLSVEEYLPEFQKIFMKRANRMRELLRTRTDVCFVAARQDSLSEIIKFTKFIAEKFPNLKKINFLNVVNNETEKSVKLYDISKKIQIYEVTDNDVCEKGKSAIMGWSGNAELWKRICSKLYLKKSEYIKTIKFCGLKFYVRDKHSEILGALQSIGNTVNDAIKSQNVKSEEIEKIIQNSIKQINTNLTNQLKLLTSGVTSLKAEIGNSLDKEINNLQQNLYSAVSKISTIVSVDLRNNFYDFYANLVKAFENDIINLNYSLDSKLKQNIEGLHNQLNILATEQSFLKETLDTALGNQISRVIKDLTSVSEFIQNLLKLNSDLSDSLTGLNSSFDDRLNAKYNRLIDRINFVSDLAHKILKNNSDLSDAIVGVNKNIGDGLLQNQQQIINSISSVSDLSQNILEYNKDLSDVISELNQKIEAGTDEHQKTLIENVNSITELIKQVLKYNFDLSKTISGINDSFKDQLNVNNNQLNECIHSVTGLTQKMSQNNSDILNAIAELDKQQSAIKNATEQTGAAIAEIQSGIANDLKSLPIEIETKQRNIAKLYSEPYWANIYHDTIINSTWLKDKSVSPGRWAVSYIVLYVLYRVLNEVKPASILECGLGQSSKLMVQYAQNNNADLIICENNPDWASFFEKNFPGADRYIKLLDVEMVEVVPPYKSRTYVGFKDAIKGKKFNMIMIDGPLGSERYSRPQILDVVDNLDSSFIIMLDDMNRIGEQESWKLLKEKLEQKGIAFKERIYSSDKSLGLLCSLDLQFLTSL